MREPDEELDDAVLIVEAAATASRLRFRRPERVEQWCQDLEGLTGRRRYTYVRTAAVDTAQVSGIADRIEQAWRASGAEPSRSTAQDDGSVRIRASWRGLAAVATLQTATKGRGLVVISATTSCPPAGVADR